MQRISAVEILGWCWFSMAASSAVNNGDMSFRELPQHCPLVPMAWNPQFLVELGASSIYRRPIYLVLELLPKEEIPRDRASVSVFRWCCYLASPRHWLLPCWSRGLEPLPLWSAGHTHPLPLGVDSYSAHRKMYTITPNMCKRRRKRISHENLN